MLTQVSSLSVYSEIPRISCVCAHVGLYMFVCMHVSVHVYMYMWRPEFNIKCLTQLILNFF